MHTSFINLVRMAAVAASVLLCSVSIASAQQARLAPGQGSGTSLLIANNVHDAAVYYHLDPILLISLIEEESGSNPWAMSSKGAMGLTQLMPATARNFGVRNPFNPRENIFACALYLRQLLDKYNDVDLALAAYSAGSGAVDKYRGVPPYHETIHAINKITVIYQRHLRDDFRSTNQLVLLGSHFPAK
jgi:soluble lytic murein transglycosylase-like protein